MNIAIIIRNKVERIPPIISLAEILAGEKHQVTVITTGITNGNKMNFKSEGIKTIVIPYEITKSAIRKIQYVYLYRKKLSIELEQGKFDLIWIEGAGTFRTVLGIIEKYPFVMQISELYDYPEAAPVRKAISKLIHKAKVVVMPEINSAVLYQVKYNLLRRPCILTNKPYFYLKEKDMKQIEKKYSKELKVFEEKKVILYQGIIAKERNLSNYIKAVKKMDADYQFVFLGTDYGMIEEYRKIDSNIIHIDFIPAPEYLIFTSKAYIGLITYDALILNCAYCAPNKLYEYGRYGLPMLGNDIPGLRNTIGYYDAGVIVDECCIESICEGIRKISENYERYSANSLRLYEETDNVEAVRKIITYCISK